LPSELWAESSAFMSNWRLRREDCLNLIADLDALRRPLD
jgi:hypothetical protein